MQLPALSTHLQLLLILCKPVWSADDLGYIKKHFSTNKSKLLKFSERHRILPLLWSAQQQLSIFSDENLQELKRRVEQNQSRTFQVASLQTKLEKSMNANGVNGFFLKGISLAKRYYKDIAERHVLDIDLFVGDKGLQIMSRVLNEMGYQSFPDISSFNKVQLNYFLKTHHDLYFFNPNDKNILPVELHWKLRGPWSSFDLVPESSLGAVDEFLYLCVHGTEHGWFRLKWLMDLPRMLLVENFEWTQVSKRARELNCVQQLEITLIILDQIQLMKLPDHWKGILKAEKYQFQVEYILTAIAAETIFQDNDRNRLRYFRFLWTLNGARGVVPKLMNFMTSHNDWKLIQLPEPLFFVYFILRPFFWLYRRFRIQA